MIKTPNLDLPIYDKPSTDTFKVADWNKANENIDYVFGELKNNPNVNAIDIKAREDIINNHREVTSQMDNITLYITPQMFGAKGDGVTDDTKAIQDCMTFCFLNKKVMFVPKAIYIIMDIIDIPAIKIIGDGAIFKIKNQKTSREHLFIASNVSFQIEGITFLTDCMPVKCSSLGLYDCTDVSIKNCKFEIPLGQDHNGYLDLYTGNKNITVENCIFNDLSNWTGGGFWVRDVNNHLSANIRIKNCVFNHKTADEAITIYAQGIDNNNVGNLKDVIVEGCTFNILNGTNTPAYAITLGNTGNTRDVTIDKCIFNCDRVRVSVIGAKINTTKPSTTKNINVTNCVINAKNQAETGVAVISSTDLGCMTIKNTEINLDDTFTKPLGLNCDFINCKSNSKTNGFQTCNLINCEHTQIGGVVSKDGAIIKGNKFILTDVAMLYQRTLDKAENVQIKDNNIITNVLFTDNCVYSATKPNVKFEISSNVGIGRINIFDSLSLIHDNVMDFTQATQNGTKFYNNVIKGVFIASGS